MKVRTRVSQTLSKKRTETNVNDDQELALRRNVFNKLQIRKNPHTQLKGIGFEF